MGTANDTIYSDVRTRRINPLWKGGYTRRPAARDMESSDAQADEGMASHWTTAEGAVAVYMNDLPKLVRSRTLESASWNNTTLVKDHVAEEVARLTQQGSGNMFVFGCADLSPSLMDEGRLYEYRIGVAPVIHGRGRRLFSGGHNPQSLQLLKKRVLDNGCVIFRYRAGRDA